MKKIILLLIAIILSAPLYAQHKPGAHQKPPKIEDVVSNLSARQKRQLEAIDEEHRTQLDVVKKELKQVRDSVRYYMDQYGDYSSQVNRLMERESALQLRVNKIQYNTKVKIDKVLTPAQYKELKENMKRQKKK